MSLRVVGAGLPRTGTRSLKEALEHLLGGRCYHMSVIPGHPFDLGCRSGPIALRDAPTSRSRGRAESTASPGTSYSR